MKDARYSLILLPVFLLVVFARLALAGPETYAQYVMGGMLVNFNHSLTDAEKAELKALIEDSRSREHERVLAHVLINVQHTVSADDRVKLDALLTDKTASIGEKLMATILLNLNHTMADADKDKLLRFGHLPPK